MQYYENRLFRKLVAVKNHLDKINEFDYYSDVSYKAIDSYRSYINLLIRNFDEIDVSVLRKIYSDLNFSIIPSMRVLQRSTTENIPWSMVSCLDSLLNECLGDQCLLLFRPQWNFNYSVQIYCLVESLRDRACEIFPFLESEIYELFPKEKIHVFSFPYLEKTNVLLHSVIGHEIGHFYHANWQNKTETQRKFESIFTELLKHYRELNKGDLIKPAEDAQHGMKIILGMCREIFSDIIGYYLFGPSIVFALHYISIFEQKFSYPSEKNNYYPTIKYRIRYLYDNYLKVDNVFNSVKVKQIDDIVDTIRTSIQEYLAEKDDLYIVYESETELKHFTQLCEDFIQDVDATFTKFSIDKDRLQELYKNLDKGIPINEYNQEPTDMNEILYVGWLKYFYDIEATRKDEYVKDYQINMRLLLKSLNSSFIHKKFIGE